MGRGSDGKKISRQGPCGIYSCVALFPAVFWGRGAGRGGIWKRIGTSHAQHYIHTPELSRDPSPASLHTRLGGWTKFNIKERNRGVIVCIVVGGVPSGGYMLRFT